ncbi:MAG TPA: hypothetical protein VND65_18240 [Candidatus Binatia bacterium]|nr:hypothetical protein [Candidatus Binatia bacterium]
MSTSTPYEIPLLDTPQTLSIVLAGISYQLRVVWNEQNQSWVLDIADAAGTPILQGIPLVTGADLLEQFGYLEFGGQLIVQTDNNVNEVPSFTTLGSTGHLYFVVITP